MSVKLMGIVYDARFYDLTFQRKVRRKTGEEVDRVIRVTAATAKAITLALADHANDQGEGAYPGLTLLQTKTELSRNSVIAAMESLKRERVVQYVGLSRYGTNNYTINRPLLEAWTRRPGQERRKASEATSLVKPLPKTSEATALKPSVNQNIDRYSRIVNLAVGITGGAASSTDADLFAEWIANHEDKWIEKALAMTKAKGARSLRYTDTILVGWEANGYPKDREQRRTERNGNHQQNTHAPVPTPATDADRALAASIKAQRGMR